MISKEVLENVAKLSRLNLDEEEKELYANQLSQILDTMEQHNTLSAALESLEEEPACPVCGGGHHHHDHDEHSHKDDNHNKEKHKEDSHSEEKHKEDNLSEDSSNDSEFHNEDSEEEHEETDEHIWTSPVNEIIMTEKICETLSKALPEEKENFQKNAESYISQL